MKKGILMLSLMAISVSSSALGLGFLQKARWYILQGAAKLTLMMVDKAKEAPNDADKAKLIDAAEKSIELLKQQLLSFAEQAKDAEVSKQVNEYIVQLDNALKTLKMPAPSQRPPMRAPAPA